MLIRRLVVLIGLLCLVLPAALHAQAPDLSYERYDVEIAVQPDGSFLVREIQRVRFGGHFQTGFAELPTEYTQNLLVTGLSVDGVSYTPGNETLPQQYNLEYLPNQIGLSWRYNPTEPGDIREFILEYQVFGGLWVYEEGDILEWRAVPADRSGIPVEQSTVTVTLPAPLGAEAMPHIAFGPRYEAEVVTPGEVRFVASEPLRNGVPFQVRVGFPHGLVEATRAPWQVQEDEAALIITQPLIHTDVTIRPDGTIAVVERQEVEVSAGALHSGYRDLSLVYLESIRNVRVAEGESPLTYSAEPCDNCYQLGTLRDRRDPVAYYDANQQRVVFDPSRFGSLRVVWQVPPLVKGEATAFLVSYEVEGAILPEPTHQTLRWTPVWGDRLASAERALLTLRLPPGVSPDAVQVEGGQTVERAPDQITIEHEGPLPADRAWGVSVTLPPDATGAALPAWGQALEDARAAAVADEQTRARAVFILGSAGLLLLIGGLVGAWLLWYRHGRDAPAPLAAEYLSEPPSSLPPGVVSYLLEERVSSRGVMASVFYLAELGLLDVDFTEGDVIVARSGPEQVQPEQVVVEPSGERVTLPAHIVSYYNALARPLEKPSSLAAWLESNRTVLPSLYWQMGREAGDYFAHHPEEVRHRWLSVGQGLVLGGVLLGALTLCALFGRAGLIAVAPGLGVATGGLALIVVSRWMPQRTPRGAEEAEKWRAFHRYLSDLKSYDTLERAQRIVDEHFAYAVALGVEGVVLDQASKRGAVEPPWTRPVLVKRRRDLPTVQQEGTASSSPPIVHRPAPPRRPGGSPAPGGSEWPTLQGASDSIARSLQQGNNTLASLLNSNIGKRDTPFSLVVAGATEAAELSWEATTTTAEVLGKILESAGSFSGGGSGGFGGGGSGRSGSRGGFSRPSSSRSSIGRSSGGGGRRGFG